MATALPPGIGTAVEVDQANRFMAEQPWYRALLAQWGQNPQNVRLSESQRKILLAEARNRGIGISKDFEIDKSGNISKTGMGLGTKILIGAGIAGLAATGLGAAGIGPLSGAFGAGAGAGTAGLAAVEGLPFGLPAATASALPGAVAAGGGLPAAVTTGSRLAGLLGTGSKIADVVGGISRIGGLIGDVGETQDELNAVRNANVALGGTVEANLENQLAKNRFLQTVLDQAGPAADTQSIRNMVRAGLIADMPSRAPSTGRPSFGIVPPVPNAPTRDFASQFQSELSKRMAAGSPLTLSGVPAASPEELEAHRLALEAARASAAGGRPSTATTIANRVNQGVGLANLGKGLYDVGKDIWKLF